MNCSGVPYCPRSLVYHFPAVNATDTTKNAIQPKVYPLVRNFIVDVLEWLAFRLPGIYLHQPPIVYRRQHIRDRKKITAKPTQPKLTLIIGTLTITIPKIHVDTMPTAASSSTMAGKKMYKISHVTAQVGYSARTGLGTSLKLHFPVHGGMYSQ
jgi:hypothetical protein